ncbi:MAG: bifunctional folylpolyglutamate synthase/dihydrofolate synthase, partial [Nocardioidaceae bacterium]
ESMTERICVDGEPLSEERFVAAYQDVAPYVDIVDAEEAHPLSFFETIVAMAFAAFADAPVDAAIVEVGLGGTWDATNVVDGRVAVITPIAVDHEKYLGDRPELIAREKAGIIKPGATVVSAAQLPEVAAVLTQRAVEVGATLLWEGVDFEVVHRVPAVGGQLLRLRGLRAGYDDVFLPLYGAHQAQNAVLALVATEAFLGEELLDAELVLGGFAEATSPGRLEIVRRSPAIVLDAAHNPHGAAAAAAALEDSFAFNPLVGVVGVMADKDYEGVLAAFEPLFAQIVCTQNGSSRGLPAERLAEVARGIYGEDRVHVVSRLDDALVLGTTLAETEGIYGSGGVLVTGSVVTIGEARTLLRPRRSP